MIESLSSFSFIYTTVEYGPLDVTRWIFTRFWHKTFANSVVEWEIYYPTVNNMVEIYLKFTNPHKHAQNWVLIYRFRFFSIN